MGRSFTEQEKEILSANPYVKNVTDQVIHYTEEFRTYFLQQYYSARKKPRKIFIDAGFDPELIGPKRIERTAARYIKGQEDGSVRRREEKRIYRQKLYAAKEIYKNLEKARRRIERQNREIRLLDAEIDLLKRAEKLGKEGETKEDGYGKPDLCELIEAVMEEYELEEGIEALCRVLGINRADYKYWRPDR